MTAHTFCSDTESNLILFTYYFVKKASKARYCSKTLKILTQNPSDGLFKHLLG